MVEISPALIAAATSTLIAVTMATIFFCCWRKKGAGTISDSNSTKDKVQQRGESTRASASPVPVVIRTENGVASDSTPEFVDSGEDLGDFSAVQRETEILRSYRKPPPPKHRARQSRAPRAFKSSTENLDIFTELSEEDSRLGTEVDDTDSALLRSHSGEKETTIRDARSSMLADIEQTLAALHMSEDTQQPPEDGSPVKDTPSPKICISERTSEGKGDVFEQRINTSESQDAPLCSTNTDSPKSSPIAKPKRGPKISPKPSPKPRAKQSTKEYLAGSNDKLNNQETESSGPILSSQTEQTNQVPEAATSQASSSPEEDATPNIKQDLPMVVTAMASKIVSEAMTEVAKQNISSENVQSQLTIELSASPSNDAEVIQQISSELTPEGENNLSASQSLPISNAFNNNHCQEISPAPAATDTDEDPVPPCVNHNGTGDQSEEDAQPNRRSTSPTSESPGRDAADLTLDPSTTAESPAAEVESPLHGITKNGATSEDQDRQHETSPSNGRSPEEHGKQRRESSEDQTGKGKTSKIPIRAGSKPRSSPPMVLSGEAVPDSPT